MQELRGQRPGIFVVCSLISYPWRCGRIPVCQELELQSYAEGQQQVWGYGTSLLVTALPLARAAAAAIATAATAVPA